MSEEDLIHPPVERWSVRRQLAAKHLLEALEEYVDASLATTSARSDWVDQASSPLGRRRHLELVRSGVLKGVRDRRRVLVRREEIDRFLARADADAHASKVGAADVLHDLGFRMESKR